MKFGVADYGLNVWDAGVFDYEQHWLGLKSISFQGIESGLREEKDGNVICADTKCQDEREDTQHIPDFKPVVLPRRGCFFVTVVIFAHRITPNNDFSTNDVFMGPELSRFWRVAPPPSS